jgi:hypothetical protein
LRVSGYGFVPAIVAAIAGMAAAQNRAIQIDVGKVSGAIRSFQPINH